VHELSLLFSILYLGEVEGSYSYVLETLVSPQLSVQAPVAMCARLEWVVTENLKDNKDIF